jgi:hypothetical protein
MEFTRQSEHDVEMPGWSQVTLPVVEPLAYPAQATLRTGPVATRVVPHGRDVALGAATDMPAQGGRATVLHCLGSHTYVLWQLVDAGKFWKCPLEDPL